MDPLDFSDVRSPNLGVIGLGLKLGHCFFEIPAMKKSQMITDKRRSDRHLFNLKAKGSVSIRLVFVSL